LTSEEQKLVDFFRSDAGAGFGQQGDFYNLTPAETAIVVMRAAVAHAEKSKYFRERLAGAFYGAKL
jgi:hypothetical protein